MATDNKEELRDDLRQLREDLQALREDFGKATGNLYEAGRRSVRSAGQDARNTVDKAAKQLSDGVTERPLTSLLVAAGAGLLLGAFFRCR